ncbi:MAG: DNA polymerase IV [Lachnospiraceae bacterium]|nr:DNA polymerase IV [Lachnospiraceae bacterium]
MGIIFHIDVNSAFLSWSALEQLSLGNPVDLRTVPSIVGGDTQTRHGIVTAKSIPAKAFGIETAEPVVSAFKKCPGLIMVPPNHKLYSAYSQALMEHLSSFCPYIEQASIDECYMDFTPIMDNFSSPEEGARVIKDSVYEKFGFTVNVGISDKKVLAKMASDFKKPNLVHTLYSHEIREKMWHLPVSRLFLCGKSATETLHKLGIRTIGELAQFDLHVLESHMKSMGTTLWQFANGIDDSPLILEQVKAKGIGNSTTLSADVTSPAEAHKVLLTLAESVGARLRKHKNLAGMVTTEIKYATFKSVSHQCSLFSPTAANDIIYRTACKLFDELWDGSPVRLLGVRCTKLTEEGDPVQMNLFDYVESIPTKSATTSAKKEKLEKLDAALDSIRGKYGKDIIKRGSLTDSPKNKHS